MSEYVNTVLLAFYGQSLANVIYHILLTKVLKQSTLQ